MTQPTEPAVAESPPPQNAAAITGLSPLALAVVAAAVAALVALLHDDPVAATRQSARHVRAALALASGDGLTLWDGAPFARFPPLFAALLAPLCALGVPVVASVATVNAAAYGAGLLGMSMLARELRLPLPWLLPLAWGALAAHVAMLRGARPDLIAISASSFAILGVARVAATSRSSDARDSGVVTPGLWLASGACCVVALTRYMGAFTLLPVVAVALLFTAGPRKRWARISVFAAIAGGPLALWLARNGFATGFLLGMSRTAERRAASDGGLGAHAAALLQTVGLDLFSPRSLGLGPILYDGVADAGASLARVAAVAAVGLLVAGAVLATRSQAPVEERAVDPLDRFRSTVFWVSLAFAAWYVTALLVLWTIGNNDPIYTRYVAPVYTPLLLAIASAAARARDRGASGAPAALCLGLALLVVGAVNAPKSAALLQSEPPDALVERHTRSGRERWFRELDWEMAWFAQSVPRLREAQPMPKPR